MKTSKTYSPAATLFFVSLLITLFCSLADAREQVRIFPETTYLLDYTGELELADLAKPANKARFKSSFSSNYRFGITSAALWLKFKINDPLVVSKEPDQNWLIVIDKAFSYVDLYVPVNQTDGIGQRKYSAGTTQDISDRSHIYRYPVFTFPESTALDRHFYLRIGPKETYTHTSLNFSMYIETRDSFVKISWKELSFYGVVIGIMGAMILYNFFLFILLRDKAYFLYIGYISCFLVYLFFRAGLIGILEVDHLKFATIPLICFAFVFASLFAQTFLSTKEHSPLIHKLIWLLIAGSTLTVLGIVLGRPKEANTLIHVLGLIAPIVLLGAGIKRFIQGYTPARGYLAAWIMLLFSSVIAGGIGLGFIPSNFFTTHALFIGTALESILLSIALGDRIRTLEIEKQQLKEQEQHLKRLSITDSLTGLYNKRWFSKALSSEIKNCRRLSAPLSLMVLDVDHFKGFNDTFGHIAGDKVLKTLGRLMRAGIRESDIACRYGGEEFSIILPKTRLKQAMEIAERLRQKFEMTEFNTDTDRPGQATISIGVTELSARETGKSFFGRADKALYTAKSSGRNQVTGM